MSCACQLILLILLGDSSPVAVRIFIQNFKVKFQMKLRLFHGNILLQTTLYMKIFILLTLNNC
jgi:hypothetical protein